MACSMASLLGEKDHEVERVGATETVMDIAIEPSRSYDCWNSRPGLKY